MIEPMCDKAYAIFAEAKSLDPPGDKTAKASFAVLTNPRVFQHFLTLNPSILKAIRWRKANRGGAIAPPAAAQAPAVSSDAMPAPAASPLPPPASLHPAPVSPAYLYEIPDRFLQERPGR